MHTRRGPQFHFRGDEQDDSSSESDEPPPPLLSPTYSLKSPVHATSDDDDDHPPPPLRLRPAAGFNLRLTPPTTYVHQSPRSPQRSPRVSPTNSALNVTTGVPFPRAPSPLSPAPSPTTSSPAPVRPTPARTSSTPVILLSNGKPLKSSLKSSSSSPHVPSSTSSTAPAPAFHLRARSAPSTPSLALASPTESEHPPGTPKAVHFPADGGLETVLLFKRSARPASVSFPLDDETETETETDRDAPRWSGGVSMKETKEYPFPRVSPLNPRQEVPWRYTLHAPGVPRVRGVEADVDGSMVRLERVWLDGQDATRLTSPDSTPTPDSELALRGTVRVRNAAFEKNVYVRFTLDGWATTSEVRASWVGATDSEDEPGPAWDRFEFTVRLADYAHSRPHSQHHHHGHHRHSYHAFSHSHPHPHNPSVFDGVGGRDLAPLGVGGVGRGLESRELVLVVRAQCPWVARGGIGEGVGPYLWADQLAPLSASSTQPSGQRQWVGQGEGGHGEWWDNNGGANYKVGFRVERLPVPETEPALPASPAVPIDGVSASGQPPTSTATTLIPFPSASGDVSPSFMASTAPSADGGFAAHVPGPGSAAGFRLQLGGHRGSPPPAQLTGSFPSGGPTQTSSPPALAPGTGSFQSGGAPPITKHSTTTTPPPPPPPRTAHAQALAAKLGRLSLRNYAAPVARSVSLPGGVTVPSVEREKKVEESKEKDEQVTPTQEKEVVVEEKHEETTPTEEPPAKSTTPPPAPAPSSNVGLYWPWGAWAPTPASNTASKIMPPSPPRVSLPAPEAIVVRGEIGGASSTAEDNDDTNSDDDRSSVDTTSSPPALEMEVDTPPTSPLGGSEAVMPEPDEKASTPKAETTPTEPAETSTRPPMHIPMPAPGLLSVVPPMSPDASPSSNLYKAFVKQWCFVGNGASAGK